MYPVGSPVSTQGLIGTFYSSIIKFTLGTEPTLVTTLASCSQTVTRPEFGVTLIEFPLSLFCYANSVDCSISDDEQILPDAHTSGFSHG